MRLTPARAFASCALAVVATGCGGGDRPAASGPTQPVGGATSSPTVSPCPAATGGAVRWPSGVPADLPRPPGVSISSTSTTAQGLRIVRFSTPTSLRQSVLFVVNELRKAGYVLGRGDAEQNEADAPFVRGDLRGQMRMVAVAPCRTEWLLAVVRVRAAGGGSNSPLLPTRSPSGSPSPLPFGNG